MSSDLQWLVIRNNSSHLVKKKNVGFRHFSTDPLNPKNIHNRKNCGMARRRAINVQPHPSGKGVVVIYKKKGSQRKPAEQLATFPLTKGARKTMTSIKGFIKGNRYRRDLRHTLWRRASVILRSQRTIVPRKAGVAGAGAARAKKD